MLNRSTALFAEAESDYTVEHTLPGAERICRGLWGRCDGQVGMHIDVLMLQLCLTLVLLFMYKYLSRVLGLSDTYTHQTH